MQIVLAMMNFKKNPQLRHESQVLCFGAALDKILALFNQRQCEKQEHLVFHLVFNNVLSRLYSLL